MQEEASKANLTTQEGITEYSRRISELATEGISVLPEREGQQARLALQAAQARKDVVGEALAYRAIAIAAPLTDYPAAGEDGGEQLSASFKPLPGAMAWREAAEAWQRAGDGPGRMEALCAFGRFRAAQALGRLETKRPLAASRVLNYYGTLLLTDPGVVQRGWSALDSETFASSQRLLADSKFTTMEEAEVKARKAADPVGFDLLQEAAAILAAHAPESPEMCAVAYNLGAARLERGELAEADRQLTQALSIADHLTLASTEAQAAILSSLAQLAERQGDARRAQSLRARAAALPAPSLSPLYYRPTIRQPKGLLVAKGEPGAAAARVLRAVTLKPNASRDHLSEYEFTGVAGGPHDIAPPAQADYTTHPWMSPENIARLSPQSRKMVESILADYQKQQEQQERMWAQLGKEQGREVQEQLSRMEQRNIEKMDPNPKRQRKQRDTGNQAAPPDAAQGKTETPQPELLPETQRLMDQLRQRWRESGAAGDASENPEVVEAIRRYDYEAVQQGNYFPGADPLADFFRFYRHSSFSRVVSDMIAQHKTDEVFRLTETEREDIMRGFLVERALFVQADGLRLSEEDRRGLSFSYTFMHGSSAQNLAGVFADVTGVSQRFDSALKTPGTPKPTLARAVEEYLSADRELEKTLDEMSKLFTRRYALLNKMSKGGKVSPPAFPTLEEARRSLAADDVYVSFSTGVRQTHVFITKRMGTPSAWTLAIPRQDLYDQVIRFRDDLSRGASPDEVTRAGRKLYAALFPAEVRAALSGARRVIISPEGFLWNLPFAALVINDAGAPRFLGIEKSLTYAQSLSLLRGVPVTPDTHAAPATREAVVVGISNFDASKLRPSFADGGELKLDPLPNAKAEAVSIAQLYGVTPLLDEGATEAALRRRAPGASLLHIATHGYARSEMGMASALILSVPARQEGSADDGLLQAWEILSQLRLRADLVVLSACETARGPGGYGDGFGRLIRSLQAAGAGAVVASQWRVADDSTKLLMETFHRYLRQGLTKDDALREAMKTLQANPDTAHPYHWAPFILTGNVAALDDAARK
jgi:CHAT domain-containing protein